MDDGFMNDDGFDSGFDDGFSTDGYDASAENEFDVSALQEQREHDAEMIEAQLLSDVDESMGEYSVEDANGVVESVSEAAANEELRHEIAMSFLNGSGSEERTEYGQTGYDDTSGLPSGKF